MAAADLHLDGKHLFPIGGIILAVAIWYLWGNHGQIHSAENPATIAFAPNDYQAYSWWRGHGHQGPKHYCYPDRMMLNTAPTTLQESEGTLSVANSVVGHG